MATCNNCHCTIHEGFTTVIPLKGLVYTCQLCYWWHEEDCVQFTAKHINDGKLVNFKDEGAPALKGSALNRLYGLI